MMKQTTPQLPDHAPPASENDTGYRIGLACVFAVLCGALIVVAWTRTDPAVHPLLVLLFVPCGMALCAPLRLFSARARQGVPPVQVLPACVVFVVITFMAAFQASNTLANPTLLGLTVVLACALAFAGASIGWQNPAALPEPKPLVEEPAPPIKISVVIPQRSTEPPPPQREKLAEWPKGWEELPLDTAEYQCSCRVHKNGAVERDDINRLGRCPGVCRTTVTRQCLLNNKDYCPVCNFPASMFPGSTRSDG